MQPIRMTMPKRSLSEAKEELKRAMAIHNELMEHWLKTRVDAQGQNQNDDTSGVAPTIPLTKVA